MRKMRMTVYEGCLFILLCLMSVSEPVVYTNGWTDGNYYHVKQRAVPKHSLQPHYLHNHRLKLDPKVLCFEQQSLRVRKRRDPPTLPCTPTDPLFPKQWHLNNKFEQNVMAAWARGYTGMGVVVTVLDDGLEGNHPDLIKNYATSYKIIADNSRTVDGGHSFDNCNSDGYANCIYSVTVGSAPEMGTIPLYSEPCSAILTTTYTGGSPHHHTDLHGSCTSDHTGTSTPLAAVIIALALEAKGFVSGTDGAFTEHTIHHRLGHDIVQNCEVKYQYGACEVCAYLLLKNKFCMASCPPHYYKEGNSSHSSHTCILCHLTCHNCYSPLNTQCLTCPPYSTPDYNEGTCSKSMFPWEKSSQQVGMWEPMTLIGGSLVILVLCASAGLFTKCMMQEGENRSIQTEAVVLEIRSV